MIVLEPALIRRHADAADLSDELLLSAAECYLVDVPELWIAVNSIRALMVSGNQLS